MIEEKEKKWELTEGSVYKVTSLIFGSKDVYCKNCAHNYQLTVEEIKMCKIYFLTERI